MSAEQFNFAEGQGGGGDDVVDVGIEESCGRRIVAGVLGILGSTAA